MGDLRSTWRELTGPLVEAGHRVAVMDLRGHGDSDTTFATHGDVVTGQDALALVEHLGGPAVLVGNSMGAGAAALGRRRATRPRRGPRPDRPVPARAPDAGDRRRGPCTASSGCCSPARGVRRSGRPYYRGYLNRGTKAPWLDEHVADLRAAMKDPAHLRSFRHLTVQLTHAPVEARVAGDHGSGRRLRRRDRPRLHGPRGRGGVAARRDRRRRDAHPRRRALPAEPGARGRRPPHAGVPRRPPPRRRRPVPGPRERACLGRASTAPPSSTWPSRSSTTAARRASRT